MDKQVENKHAVEICGVAARGLAAALSGSVSAAAADRVREAARNHARAVRMRRTWKRLATGAVTAAASLAVVFSLTLQSRHTRTEKADLEACMALVALTTVVTEYDGLSSDGIELTDGTLPAAEEYVVDFDSLADSLLLMQDSALAFDDYYALGY